MFQEDGSPAVGLPAGQGAASGSSRESEAIAANTFRKNANSRIGPSPDGRTVRIGRSPAMVVEPERASAELAGILDLMSRIEQRQRESEGLAQQVLNVEGKFDKMREAFDSLEAHVSIGLKNSIAEAVKTEVAVLRDLVGHQRNYRTRYRIACIVSALLAGALVYVQYGMELRKLLPADM